MRALHKLVLALRVLLACALLATPTAALAARASAAVVWVAPGPASGGARARAVAVARARVRVTVASAHPGSQRAVSAAPRWEAHQSPRAASRPLYLLRHALLR